MPVKLMYSLFALLLVTFQPAKAQTSASQGDTLTTVVGKWSGTYAGDSSGKFELAINQDNGKKLVGQIHILTDDSNQKPITLKTISWKDGKLIATYTDPEEGDDVSFTGTYTNPDLEGSWKADEGQSTGTWQLTRVNP